MYKPQDILEAREKRVELQQDLLQKYKIPLLNVRVNYPGIDKDNNITREIINVIDNILSDMFDIDIYYKMLAYTAEGPILIMLINKDVKELKEIAIDIENKHTLGRCMDIDVYDIFGKSISRTELGHESRKCFLCDEIAHNCVRARRHSQKEIIRFIRDKYLEYIKNFYGDSKS